MIEPDALLLDFEALQARLLLAVHDAGLDAYARRVELDLSDLSRTLSFCVVLRDRELPQQQHAEVEVHYDVFQTAAIVEPDERNPDPEDLIYELEVAIKFHLISPIDGPPVAELEAFSRPLVERLNAALEADPPLQLYTTVANDFAGKELSFGAYVPYLVHLRLLAEEFDPTELTAVLMAGLLALTPPMSGENGAPGGAKRRRR
ncbi:MAG: hypothetical protein KIT58_02255 [Planctomycetota bacterium]|nr:hypothetical protein [Planctomycetota bacterium]